MATPDDIKQVWAMLIAAYPTYAKDQPAEQLRMTLKLYQRMLQDIDANVLQAATLQHIAVSKFFPTIAELRQVAGAIAAPATGTAMEGWGEVTAAMADARFYRYADGFHQIPQFSPITQRVVDAMGWGNLCVSEDSTADRARFLQAFDVMAKRAGEERMLLPAVRDLTARLRAAHRPELPAGAGR